MHIRSHLVISILLGLSLLKPVVAQDSTASGQRSANVITASASSERVRFTAPSSVVLIRIEIYNASGRKLFDNEVRGGNVLDWLLQDGQAERLANDTYLCVVTVKSLSGKLSQVIGQVSVEKASASVQAVDASQMSTQQQQAIGPIEENSRVLVMKEEDNQTTTVMAHNGEEGQIIRGKGALSFRIGDFFGGKDTEQMRLTPGGNVGIGIAHPLVRLDVDGLVRSSQGIVFPDGSIQYSAAAKTFGARSNLPDPSFQNLHSASGKTFSGAQEHIDVAGTGTPGHIAKWTDNSGTLGDSSIVETLSGGTNVATFGGQPATASSGNHIVEMIATGAKSPLTLVGGSGDMEFWKDQAAAGGLPTAAVSFGMAQPGVSSTNDMVFSAWNGSSWSERMRMTNGGNFGIGTTSPLGRLQVATVNDTNPGFVTAWDARHFVIGGPASSGGIGFSYDQTNQLGYIQALSPNVAWRSLVLQSGGGNVGIGTTRPAYLLDVANRMRVRQSGINTAGIWFYQTAPAVDRAFVGMLDDTHVGFYGNTGAGWGMVMETTDGTVGIGTTDPIARLHAVANGALIGVFGQGSTNSGVHGFSSGSSGVSGTTAGTSFNVAGVYGEATGASGQVVGVYGKAVNDPNGTGVAGFGKAVGGFFQANGAGLVASNPGGGDVIQGFSNISGSPIFRIQNDGTTVTRVLQITGGADLAEQFEVGEGGKPGLIVAIDPLNAGKLSIARGAYNKKVAGIISGAGNLSTGMVLPDPSGATKSLPVALSGRVWVYCDATNGPIKPGDLLTTSSTAGHAMKVTNYARAQGAIIGKAMTGLRSGRGLVLALVSLQ